jgi:hypothetical protein
LADRNQINNQIAYILLYSRFDAGSERTINPRSAVWLSSRAWLFAQSEDFSPESALYWRSLCAYYASRTDAEASDLFDEYVVTVSLRLRGPHEGKVRNVQA